MPGLDGAIAMCIIRHIFSLSSIYYCLPTFHYMQLDQNPKRRMK